MSKTRLSSRNKKEEQKKLGAKSEGHREGAPGHK
jgi:hypothetical protein